MKRLLVCVAVGFLFLSACERGTITSPVDPEISDRAFSMVELPPFEPPDLCAEANCLFGPVTMERYTKAPVTLSETFTGVEEQAATLVILASNPKTTTVKAWLNDVVVLLPSALPKTKSDEVRVPVTLLADNTLEVRLSAKPGTQIAIWVIEADEEPPIGPGDSPPIAFRLTSEDFAVNGDLSGACTAFGEGYRMADWTEVKPAVEAGVAKEDIMNGLYALILNGGVGLFETGFPFTEERHYVISAVTFDGWTVDSADFAGTEVFWLTSLATAVLPAGEDAQQWGPTCSRLA